MKKKLIIVTGGAGFIGSHLIENLLKIKKFNKFKIISVDNYSSGNKNNHIKNNRITYFNCNTVNIKEKLNKYKNKIHSIFHFGEFSRIYQSFLQLNRCLQYNINGSLAVFNFCLENQIKLIYSATSATIGNSGKDKNLSPYAFSKAYNLELLERYKEWFKFKYEIIYFYNVYGGRQISNGKMATLIGIFEDQYKNNKPLTVVKPGTQSRKFTHVDDTIKVCIDAWDKNKCKHYSISSKKNYSILEIARMFGNNIKYLPQRPGERNTSTITKKNLKNKVINRFASIEINKYINQIKKKLDKK